MALRFGTKLALFLTTLLITVQVVNLAAAYSVVRRQASIGAADELKRDRSLLSRQMEVLGDRLVEGARVLSLDFGFRQAVAMGDRPTATSAVRNLGERIAADLSVVMDMNGEVLARVTSEPIAPSEDAAMTAPLRAWAATPGEERNSLEIMRLGDAVYRLVLVPVLAPVQVGWVVLGFAIDDGLALQLKALAAQGIDVSFAARDADGSWRVLASSLVPERRIQLGGIVNTNAEEPTTQHLWGENHLVLMAALDTAPESAPVVAVLQNSLEAAMRPYYTLLTTLVWVLVTSLGLALIGGLMMARGMVRPIRDLVAAAGRVESGDLSASVPIPRDGEIGRLAKAFNQMLIGIAEQQARIAFQANHDALTGLPNRALFESELSRRIELAMALSQPLTVLLVSVNRLPEINGTLGHDAADRLIRLVAERLDAGPSKPRLIARIEGGIFLLAWDNCEAERARSLAQALLDRLGEPFAVEGATVDVDAHMGIALAPRHAREPRELIKKAEVATFTAQRGGTSIGVYDPAADDNRRERLSLMGELRLGIERGEFMLHYQPKLDLATRTVVEAEALVRWQHPTQGRLPPNEFIPLAEQTGHITRLTAWAIRDAVRQMRRWDPILPGLRVSVNVSAHDLADRTMPSSVRRVLDEHGIAAGRLCLEITESAIMHDPQRALDVLQEFASLGLAMAIDDYGSGYSSLAYLKQLPVSELKIDKAFVRDMVRDREDEMIVRSTIDLAHSLGLHVTAEGVEDRETLERLAEFGCDMAQGFYMSRPIPAEEFAGVAQSLGPDHPGVAAQPKDRRMLL